MLTIGHLTLSSPLVQAALSGFSDLPMRRLARLHGTELTMNEVLLDKLVLRPGKKDRRQLTVPADDHPVVGQLMGAEPAVFAEAADVLVEAGYDVMDINFGCPVRKVLGRCRGGYLLSQPATALEIVRRVVDSVGGRRPVTVKMRRGFDDSAGSRRDFWTIFDGAVERGVRGFTIHGRSVQQRYLGPSDWPFLAEVKRRAGRLPILGSGDLFTPHDVVRMLEQTGVDGVAVARGCIGNPWIFKQAEALLRGDELPALPAVAEQGRTIRLHFRLTADVYGADRAGKVMRKFGIHYSRLHPLAADVRRAFIEARCDAEWLAVLDRWYDPRQDWPPPSIPQVLTDLVAAGAA